DCSYFLSRVYMLADAGVDLRKTTPHSPLCQGDVMAQSAQLAKRLAILKAHLAQEIPILLRAVKSFRDLDTVARRLGFFNREESYATRVPWWPLIALLGTYSAGKST